jgi:hypothetical protein
MFCADTSLGECTAEVLDDTVVVPSQAQAKSSSICGRKKKASRLGSATLPNTVANPTTQLVDSCVRRSARLNKPDSFCAVRLEREPTKKRKISIIQIDDSSGKAGPVPLEVLQGWGINYGVDPSDLSIEALMQEPPHNPIVNNADADKEDILV